MVLTRTTVDASRLGCRRCTDAATKSASQTFTPVTAKTIAAMAAATKRIAPVTASAAPMELASFPRGGKLALRDISRRSLLSKSLVCGKLEDNKCISFWFYL